LELDGGYTEAWELAAAVEAGRTAMTLGAYALEQSETERSEGEQWERQRGCRLDLHTCANPEAMSWGANGAWRPCIRCVLFWTSFLSLLL
jgi:hypothetical protein